MSGGKFNGVHQIKQQKARVALTAAFKEPQGHEPEKKPFMPPYRENSKGLISHIYAKARDGV